MVKMKREQFVNSEDDCKVTVKVKKERLDFFSDCKVSIDRISTLPNNALGLILSFLTLKEATATSILSRRWRYTWTFTRKLDLDGISSSRILKNSGPNRLINDEERCKFVRWVDRLIIGLQHRKSSHNLEEFKLLFDLTNFHKQWIDDWLSYAIGRNVESIELSLIDIGCIRRALDYNSCYNFPYENGNFPNNLRVLRKLSTHLVNVTGEAVEMLLRHCPMLEQVSVSQSQVLSCLEIIGTSPSFKCLEISQCRNLQSLVIRDSGIVCIKYGGDIIRRFELINVPLLRQFWINVLFSRGNKGVVTMFRSILPQLEMFKIYFMYSLSWEVCTYIVSGIEMRNLKEMVVSIGEGYEDEKSLLPLINLISMSPRLQRFVLEASHQDSKQLYLLNGSRNFSIMGMGNSLAYFHLKEIEFVGYRGVKAQFEWIMHFVESKVALNNTPSVPFNKSHLGRARRLRKRRLDDKECD